MVQKKINLWYFNTYGNESGGGNIRRPGCALHTIQFDPAHKPIHKHKKCNSDGQRNLMSPSERSLSGCMLISSQSDLTCTLLKKSRCGTVEGHTLQEKWTNTFFWGDEIRRASVCSSWRCDGRVNLETHYRWKTRSLTG